MKKMALVMAAALALMGSAEACTADVGTATTDVFVRNADGSIAGSLAKGDRVIVTGKAKDGWKIVKIGGAEYRVFGRYLEIENTCLDEVKVRESVRRSKTKESGGVYNKKKCPIKGSVFEGIDPW